MNIDVLVIINLVITGLIVLLILFYIFYSREDSRIQRKKIRESLSKSSYSYDEVRELLVQYDSCYSNLLHRIFKKRSNKKISK